MDEFRTYVESLLLTQEEKNRIEEVVQLLKNEKIVTAGKGRSGNVAKLGGYFLRDSGAFASFYSDVCGPRAGEIEGWLIVVSGSGETPEMVKLAKEFSEEGGKVLLITYNPNSSVSKFSDIVVQLQGKRKVCGARKCV